MGSEVGVGKPSENEEGDLKALGLLMETSTEVILKRTMRTLGRARMLTSLDRLKAPMGSSHDSMAHNRDRGYVEEGDLQCTNKGVRTSSQEEVVRDREDEVVPGKVQIKAHNLEAKETCCMGKMNLLRAWATKGRMQTSTAEAMATSSLLMGEVGLLEVEVEEVLRDLTLPEVVG